ncbi:MAG: iron ABC transporter permease [Firmicutes bacterium]|nr:iron ABC transporter permease [Bacillota bacterium]
MKARKNTWIILGGAAFLLILVCVVSACIGSYPLSLSDIRDVILGRSTDRMAGKVFFSLRLPRVLMGVTAGAVLGVCGAVFQLLFRNPLASPDLVGVASGAGVGAACAIVLGTGGMVSVMGGAFLGGMAALAGVFLLVWLSGSNRPGMFILGGILISSLANALIMILKHAADSDGKLAAIEFWTMGSLASVTASRVIYVLWICVPSLLILILLQREIILLSLGDEQAQMLGLAPGITRVLILTLATLAVAGVISVTGVISFVGLLAPHGAFLILQRRNRSYLWLSGAVGAVLVVTADCFARSVTEGELPVSILTTLCAVPFLVFFIWKRKGRVL